MVEVVEVRIGCLHMVEFQEAWFSWSFTLTNN